MKIERGAARTAPIERTIMKKLVRIVYVRPNDEFQLLISNDGGDTWDFCLSTACQKGLHDEPETEPMLISCKILMELKKAIALGYTMVSY